MPSISQHELDRRGVPHTFRHGLGGGWTLRFGPFRAIDVGALCRRSCTGPPLSHRDERRAHGPRVSEAHARGRRFGLAASVSRSVHVTQAPCADPNARIISRANATAPHEASNAARAEVDVSRLRRTSIEPERRVGQLLVQVSLSDASALPLATNHT